MLIYFDFNKKCKKHSNINGQSLLLKWTGRIHSTCSFSELLVLRHKIHKVKWKQKFTLVYLFADSTGYDCGVYVITITEELCQNFLGKRDKALTDTMTAKDITQKRELLKKLILNLGQEKT